LVGVHVRLRQVDADRERGKRLEQFLGDVFERALQRFGGRGGCRDAEQEAHFIRASTGLLEQLRVVDGNGDLTGERRQHGDVVVVEGVWLVRLHVERADDPPLEGQRNRHFRARVRQVRV